MRKTTTLYDVLGVSQEATDLQIRSAFRDLTQKYHPDRFSGEERRRAEARFQEITEAFNVLRRAESRDRYDREISQGGRSEAMDPKEIARKLAAKGAQDYRSGNVSEAVQNLQLAINHDEACSRAHHFLGVILSRASGRERDALRHLERAVQLEPTNAVIMGEAASVALSCGMRARAERLAGDALRFDPSNTKATEVLNSIAAPEGKDREGLLSRLRRKG